MKKMFLIFNHDLSEDQKADALATFGQVQFVEMPEELKAIWANIPSDAEELEEILAPISQFVYRQAKRGDIMLVQGEYGATYFMIRLAQFNDMIPVYATNNRERWEVEMGDGSLEVRWVFKHGIFRKYGV